MQNLKLVFLGIEIDGNAIQGTRYKAQGTNETYKAYPGETFILTLLPSADFLVQNRVSNFF